MREYFKEIDQGIDILLADDEAQVHLSPEMLPFERKLNVRLGVVFILPDLVKQFFGADHAAFVLQKDAQDRKFCGR